jgi:hypothetical protein
MTCKMLDLEFTIGSGSKISCNAISPINAGNPDRKKRDVNHCSRHVTNIEL